MPWDLLPVGLDFLDSAPHRYSATEVVHRPVEAIFAAIADDPAGWGDWFPGFGRAGRYLSPAPHGVGSVREVRVGGLRLTETVLAWSTPSRCAFSVTRSSLPLARSLAHQYQVSVRGHHSVVQWTVALDPLPSTRRLVPLAGAVLPRAFRRAMTNLSIRLSHPSGPAGEGPGGDRPR